MRWKPNKRALLLKPRADSGVQLWAMMNTPARLSPSASCRCCVGGDMNKIVSLSWQITQETDMFVLIPGLTGKIGTVLVWWSEAEGITDWDWLKIMSSKLEVGGVGDRRTLLLSPYCHCVSLIPWLTFPFLTFLPSLLSLLHRRAWPARTDQGKPCIPNPPGMKCPLNDEQDSLREEPLLGNTGAKMKNGNRNKIKLIKTCKGVKCINKLIKNAKIDI